MSVTFSMLLADSNKVDRPAKLINSQLQCLSFKHCRHKTSLRQVRSGTYIQTLELTISSFPWTKGPLGRGQSHIPTDDNWSSKFSSQPQRPNGPHHLQRYHHSPDNPQGSCSAYRHGCQATGPKGTHPLHVEVRGYV
ncbi:hypothetical protein FVEG_14682 [Fusarium verticillioides 7600]|uniref:Uncharacterized protein n=1 Tax=Gibberella moniliformis (strain M3125 / FGSC 7600) TaxID=334819 RepID=W7LA72_GIBM7|nr:hypothetical protein FVEG_14682 [Fusarium verticillioides 7600]EWG36503.1 hypothetical protein FVEG_14682 [Fusarium verticillioides 7600]